MNTLLDPSCRARLFPRFRSLRPGTRARWGAFTAPRMVAHLIDQMRYTLGETRIQPRYGPLRWPVIKPAVMYWLPWPRGRIRTSPEMLETPPAEWNADLARLEALVLRFAETSGTDWPDHPLFGPMTKPAWGRFCHRHFDYHLRQFGA